MIQILIVIALFVAVSLFMSWQEHKAWNNGVCKKTNKPWIHFATDSQDGRGYTDDSGNYIWLSWINPK